jgi:DNA invertase Pin-like site-specific DNA recombinase
MSDVFGTMSAMRFGYARVSTTEQNPDSQLDALRGAGCERVFLDKASGRLTRRPEWDRLDEQLRAGDQVVVTRLSRLARSVRHLTELTAGLHERGVDLVVLHQGIDTSSSAGRFLFHVLAAQDEMLADLISEATREGLAAARARGRVGGRPTVMTPAKLRIARHMLDSGSTVTEVAGTLGVGRGTLYRHLGDQARRVRTDPTRAGA